MRSVELATNRRGGWDLKNERRGGQVLGSAEELYGCVVTEKDFCWEVVELPRLVYEPVNDVGENSYGEMLAYDRGDVLARYGRLGECLSESEIKQLVVSDERDLLTAHLAEVSECELYPYELLFIDGDLGSVIEIMGDDGDVVWVFRSMRNMLDSRVRKFPNDVRSGVVRDVFTQKIVPFVGHMGAGEKLVYFSPADEGADVEYKYGFMYVMEKVVEEKTGVVRMNSLSVKVDWDRENYESVLGDVRSGSYGEVMNKVLVLGGAGESIEDVVLEVLGRAGEEVDSEWVEKHREVYKRVGEFVGGWEEEVVERIVNNDRVGLSGIMSRMQLAWLAYDQVEVYEQVMFELQRYGFSSLALACGALQFGGVGFGGGLESLMRGVGGKDWEYHNGKCQKCGRKNVRVGPCEICESCEAKYDRGELV